MKVFHFARNEISYKHPLNNFSSDLSRCWKWFCSSVSARSAMLRSPRPPSILAMYFLPVWICGRYIVFMVTIFLVLLSITSSFSFVHFSISVLYLTKNTTRLFITLIVFQPFKFDNVGCLTLLFGPPIPTLFLVLFYQLKFQSTKTSNTKIPKYIEIFFEKILTVFLNL